LLRRLKPEPQPWPARFRCVVVVASGAGILFSAEAICEGQIVPVERGRYGFGYDPIFQVAGTGQTMAELPPQVKNRLSHRGKAFAPAQEFLLGYWGIENL
ncbi:MAG: non-canonical purine NTP pyrophosphatase, partial [Anaerolineales bacterium]|nr:non-canonical purine NTP pyrophosphatase [Anaerolineales bacterium]